MRRFDFLIDSTDILPFNIKTYSKTVNKIVEPQIKQYRTFIKKKNTQLLKASIS